MLFINFFNYMLSTGWEMLPLEERVWCVCFSAHSSLLLVWRTAREVLPLEERVIYNIAHAF